MRRGRLATLIVLGAVLTLGLIVVSAGLVTIERHTGFFAPVWDKKARGVYYVERNSLGLAWGLGWEFFTPPAYSYAIRDEFRLRHLDLAAGRLDTLGRWPASPTKGTVMRQYRGRIFNSVSARVDVTVEGVSYLVTMGLPSMPSSEHWSLQGTWTRRLGATGDWRQAWGGYTAAGERVLVDGLELLTVPGRESYPAAIMAVDAAGNSRVLLHNEDFADLYPDGVPAKLIAKRSVRHLIERGRDFRKVHDDLVAQYRGQGLNQAEASLKAYRTMEDLGYLPKRPRLVATLVDTVPSGTRVFDIPAAYLEVGLFQDIAAAIAAPGTEVDTGTGTYLKYYDDELGPRLKRWREQGHDRFAVRSDGRTYVLNVLQPN